MPIKQETTTDFWNSVIYEMNGPSSNNLAFTTPPQTIQPIVTTGDTTSVWLNGVITDMSLRERLKPFAMPKPQMRKRISVILRKEL